MNKDIGIDEYMAKMGFVRIYLSKKNHNKVLKNRKVGLFSKGVYFLKNIEGEKKQVAFLTGSTLITKIIATLILPIAIIWEGFSNTKQVWRDYIGIITGGWSSLSYFTNEEKIKFIIDNQKR